MEAFKLKRLGKQEHDQPLIRVSQQYYQLLCRIKAETGTSLGCIVEQCVDYALGNGEAWEKGLLEQVKPQPAAFHCPLLEPPTKEAPYAPNERR